MLLHPLQRRHEEELRRAVPGDPILCIGQPHSPGDSTLLASSLDLEECRSDPHAGNRSGNFRILHRSFPPCFQMECGECGG